MNRTGLWYAGQRSAGIDDAGLNRAGLGSTRRVAGRLDGTDQRGTARLRSARLDGTGGDTRLCGAGHRSTGLDGSRLMTRLDHARLSRGSDRHRQSGKRLQRALNGCPTVTTLA